MGIVTTVIKPKTEFIIGVKDREKDDVYELLYLITKSRNQNTRSDMYAYILDNHIDHPDLYLSLPPTNSWSVFSELYEKFLLTILSENSNSISKSAACYALALGYFTISQSMRTADLSGKDYITYLKEDLGADLDDKDSTHTQDLLRWSEYTADEIEAKARRYAEKANANYATEHLYNCRIDKEDNLQGRQIGTVGEKIDSLLYQMDSFSIGRKVPDESFETLDGKTVNLLGRKGKIALVDFWSSGCGPCRAKMPFLIELQEKLTDQPFELIMLNSDNERKTLDKCIEKLELEKLKIVHMGQDPLLTKWDITAFPTFLLIDQNSVMRNRGTFSNEQIVTEIEALLKESQQGPAGKDFTSAELLKNFSKSMKKWVKSGLKQANPELIKMRLDACQTCPHLQGQGSALIQKMAVKAGLDDDTCGLCGCSVQAKARILTEDCPDGAPIHDNMSPWEQAEQSYASEV